MAQIRIGFIGCGGNARGHIGLVLEMKECEVVALCDSSEASLDAARERYTDTAALPHFTDYKKMLDSVEMDAVQISTPHTLHFEQIMASLDKGLHVLSEKPMVCIFPDCSSPSSSPAPRISNHGLPTEILRPSHWRPQSHLSVSSHPG